MTNSAVEAAISTLANRMRLYVEAHIRFYELFKVDREEAIDNIDRAFEAKLEAFHSLYDVSKHFFRYFDHGDTTLMIAVRNAIHHRNHPLFRSLYWHLYLNDAARWGGASFLLSSYPTLHGAPIRMSHYVKLDDVAARLDPRAGSPHVEAMMNSERAERRFALIEGQLGFDTIQLQGSKQGFPSDQIYLDLMPIFTSAVCRVFKMMKSAGVAFRGFDAETYLGPFTSEIEVDLCHPTLTEWRFDGGG